jgi:hypothetical protein
MPAFRSVVSVLVSFVGRSFSTPSRPALRAASGRPPARRRHDGHREPASPSTQVEPHTSGRLAGQSRRGPASNHAFGLAADDDERANASRPDAMWVGPRPLLSPTA